MIFRTECCECETWKRSEWSSGGCYFFKPLRCRWLFYSSADCKSIGLRPSMVRIHHPPPVFFPGRKEDFRNLGEEDIPQGNDDAGNGRNSSPNAAVIFSTSYGLSPRIRVGVAKVDHFPISACFWARIVSEFFTIQQVEVTML